MHNISIVLLLLVVAIHLFLPADLQMSLAARTNEPFTTPMVAVTSLLTVAIVNRSIVLLNGALGSSKVTYRNIMLTHNSH